MIEVSQAMELSIVLKKNKTSSIWHSCFFLYKCNHEYKQNKILWLGGWKTKNNLLLQLNILSRALIVEPHFGHIFKPCPHTTQAIK